MTSLGGREKITAQKIKDTCCATLSLEANKFAEHFPTIIALKTTQGAYN